MSSIHLPRPRVHQRGQKSPSPPSPLPGAAADWLYCVEGGWQPIACPIPQRDDVEAELEAAGYSQIAQLPSPQAYREYLPSLMVWQAIDAFDGPPAPYPWCCWWCPVGDSIHSIWLPSLPDLTGFLGIVSPIVAAWSGGEGRR